ncbi:MAG: YebC/PmpR family DNA-binding transcriptional regulator [Xanthomonadales bacterium]|nr:YebC/PmpR family DNA-binding transcriptional regulator [Gammaproteobacteria bacterium]MBT8053678.1 YebC/PmpR family DNA-binding transcriptional regulator [Gammaproteobacteria bacterium]NND57067.1 YebC/PmpR family DNA-binding transcriptional regulator [Xanthomonadales bacterium]NNK51851.1 YebC/PmpR family DNA-binding transcriptional regulator [Xanthomonadales bacterium]NNL95874.1 YebC/PmpR family DNA-binding transcriptional regulator [Xanthomonadales bacterium]
MAGHSKWANIQHRKKAVDAKRGKIFTRVNRELTVAAREGGSDPDANPRLRLAVQKANAVNMPKDTIERTIKKATGELEGVTYEEIRYEGYAPNGVAVMVDTMTDNRNRTVAEVRHAFSKAGGNLGQDGSVAYLFNKIGVLNFEPGTPEEDVLEVAMEAGADDIVTENDGSIEVVTTPEVYSDVVTAMEDAGLAPANAEVTMRASVEVELDVDAGQKVLRLLDTLEDLDDAQAVYSNADIPDEAYDD